jgi:hypothetical protein
MSEDPKVFLENLQGVIGGFANVDKETLKAFGKRSHLRFLI